jgi:hypothetical protein
VLPRMPYRGDLPAGDAVRLRWRVVKAGVLLESAGVDTEAFRVQGTHVDAADRITAARFFHHIGDLFAEMATTEDPLQLESLMDEVGVSLRAIDELLDDQGGTSEAPPWQ